MELELGLGQISSAHKNPVANDLEIREALGRENEREKATTTTASNIVEKSCRPKFKTCCEWAVICTVIAVIWGLLALPIVYYRTLQVHAVGVVSVRRLHHYYITTVINPMH